MQFYFILNTHNREKLENNFCVGIRWLESDWMASFVEIGIRL